MDFHQQMTVFLFMDGSYFFVKKNRSAGIMIHVRIRLVNSCVYFEVEIWNCISIDIICY